MSFSSLSEADKRILWGKAAGRCEYCNELLYKDNHTGEEFNFAYHAHIIGDSENGPRGDECLSGELGSNISNIMLLCDTHHRLIDKAKPKDYPPELLHEMKRDHEERIRKQTEITVDKKSHMIIYEAKVGDFNPNIDGNKAMLAMQEDGKFLAEMYPIKLSGECAYKDDEPEYWKFHQGNLKRFLDEKIICRCDIQHKSLFALAPQPLLIELGRLIYDLEETDIYQKHRQPDTWKWQTDGDDVEFIVKKPKNSNAKFVVLNISLSGTIPNSDIEKTLGMDVAIWTITINEPNVFFMKTRKLLQEFIKIYRITLDEIKMVHGSENTIHLFPAVPNSVAIEIGRSRLPKVDLPFIIFENNKKNDGFIATIEIK